MTYTIAVTGKGGTGKSTLSACLVKLLLDKNIRPVLAVDADPNSSLGTLVGVEIDETISGTRDDLMEEKSRATGVPKARLLDQKIAECIVESQGFDMVTMGRPEGAECYCYVNNLLRRALSMLKANYRVTVIDNEAGMEHLSRMNVDTIDVLVMVSEPTVVSSRAVARIVQLASALPVEVKRRVLVWNKCLSTQLPEEVLKPIESLQFDETVFLPMNEGLGKLSILGESVMDACVPEEFCDFLQACIKNTILS